MDGVSTEWGGRIQDTSGVWAKHSKEKMDSDPEASKVLGSLGASVRVQANGFQMHCLQISLISSLARESLTTN